MTDDPPKVVMFAAPNTLVHSFPLYIGCATAYSAGGGTYIKSVVNTVCMVKGICLIWVAHLCAADTPV